MTSAENRRSCLLLAPAMHKFSATSDRKGIVMAGRLFRWLFGFIFALLMVAVLYTGFVLWWSYSTGEKTGYVEKFSKRGVLFKTWEGELTMVPVPGAPQEVFSFSVRDDSVAAHVNAASGHRVVLHYEEHVGVPTNWFGETGFFVTDVRLAGPGGESPR